MKKIIVLFIIFLNLHLNWADGKFEIGGSILHAQSMGQEEVCIDELTGYQWASWNGCGDICGAVACVHCLMDLPDCESDCTNPNCIYNSNCFCPDCATHYNCQYNHTCSTTNEEYDDGSGAGGGSAGGGSGTGDAGSGGSSGNESVFFTTSKISARLLASPNIIPATVHVSNISDNATAKQNLKDASSGLNAHRSNYGNAPGGTVALNNTMLKSIESLSSSYSMSISEIAGGSHSVGSSHYSGNAIDVNYVNGVRVINMSDAKIIEFRNACYQAGANVVYDPVNEPNNHNNHFHIQW